MQPTDHDRADLSPHLDEALDELDTKDRDAVLMRCVQARPFADIGAMLRLSDDAARKRVERALEKMRASFSRRGLTSSAATLSAVLGAQTHVAVPADLVTSVCGAVTASATQSVTPLIFGIMNSTKVPRKICLRRSGKECLHCVGVRIPTDCASTKVQSILSEPLDAQGKCAAYRRGNGRD